MKKTIVLILAAMMTVSMSSAVAYAADAADSKEVVKAKDSKKAKKQKADVKEVTFIVHLHCENCVAKVFDNLSRAKGVKDLNVSLEKQTVEIKYDSAKTSEEVLKTTIEKLGYPVSGKLEPGHEHHHHGHDHGHDHGHKH